VPRASWIDDASQQPLIEKQARELESFTQTFLDGHVSDAELKAQEDRVTALMREIEPKLDDALHAKVTQLLCELTAYDLMQVFSQMQTARPKTKFRG
jgi:3-methyladenine DNA glycosylase Tag